MFSCEFRLETVKILISVMVHLKLIICTNFDTRSPILHLNISTGDKFEQKPR